jgi:hypothetical protein
VISETRFREIIQRTLELAAMEGCSNVEIDALFKQLEDELAPITHTEFLARLLACERAGLVTFTLIAPPSLRLGRKGYSHVRI